MVYSAHDLSAAAIPASSASVMGSSKVKKLRESHWGAQMTLLRALGDGKVSKVTSETLDVSPMNKNGSNIWNYVQPLMSSGGHILGAPAPLSRSDHEITQAGAMLLLNIVEKGQTFHMNRPEYALSSILALIDTLPEEQNALRKTARQELLPFLCYAIEPKADLDSGNQSAFRSQFISGISYQSVREFLEDRKFLLDDDDEVNECKIPSWKKIKEALSPSCSNKFARFIRRLFIKTWPKKRRKMRISMYRSDCLAPISFGDPIGDFIWNCWRTRASSISCSVAKKPPKIVCEILDTTGHGGNIKGDPKSDLVILRSGLMKKFKSFQEWAHLQHYKSGPVKWSDTLSKFANVSNHLISRYNELVPSQSERFLRVTSFVPGDLAPEMYCRGKCCSDYFINNCGMYYCYSPQWRQDAVIAYCEERLPADITKPLLESSSLDMFRAHVTAEDALAGGLKLQQALKKASVTHLQFCDFLRSYYFSGAFLTLNLALPCS